MVSPAKGPMSASVLKTLDCCQLRSLQQVSSQFYIAVSNRCTNLLLKSLDAQRSMQFLQLCFLDTKTLHRHLSIFMYIHVYNTTNLDLFCSACKCKYQDTVYSLSASRTPDNHHACPPRPGRMHYYCVISVFIYTL